MAEGYHTEMEITGQPEEPRAFEKTTLQSGPKFFFCTIQLDFALDMILSNSNT